MEELRARHPRFQGNWEDLRQFELLTGSKLRNQEREEALQAWEQYKLGRQFAALGTQRFYKGPHISALTSRTIDLTGADLDGICVGYVDLRGVILDDCNLRGAWLKGANLENASLRRTDFSPLPESPRGAGRLLHAFMRNADLTGATLVGVDFSYASLNDAALSEANLTGTNLSHVSLVRASIEGAILRNACVYGIAAWDLKGKPRVQEDLVITDSFTVPSAVNVDSLEIAQFVNLLMANDKIRDVIDTIGKKGVLILGRFTEERKSVLDKIRTKLRELGFVPMIFDFERPTQRDFTETIKTLAGLSLFIIADMTNPKSCPLELQATVPNYMIPFVPIIQQNEEPFSMFRDLKQKHGEWVLDVLKYDSGENLIKVLDDAVIKPALERSEKLTLKKAEEIGVRHVNDYLCANNDSKPQR